MHDKLYKVTGVKNDTGEVKVVFHAITFHNFKMRGERNARNQGYSNFTLVEHWTLKNNVTGQEKIIID